MRRRHLGEFGLVIALILLGFMERPIRIEIAIDHQRSEGRVPIFPVRFLVEQGVK